MVKYIMGIASAILYFFDSNNILIVTFFKKTNFLNVNKLLEKKVKTVINPFNVKR